jgi:hypothetical protein
MARVGPQRHKRETERERGGTRPSRGTLKEESERSAGEMTENNGSFFQARTSVPD